MSHCTEILKADVSSVSPEEGLTLDKPHFCKAHIHMHLYQVTKRNRTCYCDHSCPPKPETLGETIAQECRLLVAVELCHGREVYFVYFYEVVLPTRYAT